MTEPQVTLRQLVVEIARKLDITPLEAYQLLAEVRFDFGRLVRMYSVLAEVRFDFERVIYTTQLVGEVRYNLDRTVFVPAVMAEVMWQEHLEPVMGGIFLYDCTFERPEGIALSGCQFERPAGIVTGGAKHG